MLSVPASPDSRNRFNESHQLLAHETSLSETAAAFKFVCPSSDSSSRHCRARLANILCGSIPRSMYVSSTPQSVMARVSAHVFMNCFLGVLFAILTSSNAALRTRDIRYASPPVLPQQLASINRKTNIQKQCLSNSHSSPGASLSRGASMTTPFTSLSRPSRFSRSPIHSRISRSRSRIVSYVPARWTFSFNNSHRGNAQRPFASNRRTGSAPSTSLALARGAGSTFDASSGRGFFFGGMRAARRRVRAPRSKTCPTGRAVRCVT